MKQNLQRINPSRKNEPDSNMNVSYQNVSVRKLSPQFDSCEMDFEAGLAWPRKAGHMISRQQVVSLSCHLFWRSVLMELSGV